MDTFMDKLAQKLTAQEMIKANAAADAEEMKKMQIQIDEYRKILESMQVLLDNAEEDGEEIIRLVEESIAKIEQMQADTRRYDRLQGGISELEETMSAQVATMDEKLIAMDAKLTAMDDNIHKECVKVYRNVQAVIVEENAKQTGAIDTVKRALYDKLDRILKFSIAALIAAAGSILFQLLVYLNVI